MSRWSFVLSILVVALGFGTVRAVNAVKLYPHPVAEVGYDAFGIVSADLNGDGRDDLVTANGDMEYAGVSVLMAGEEGIFAPHVVYSTCEYPITVAVGDFDGNERLDLAVSCIGYTSGGPDDFSILLGNGDGTFQTEMRFGTITEPDAIAVGDFDGDEEQDLSILPQGGTVTGADRPAIALGDFNHDSRDDLAINGGGLALHYGNGDGSFGPPNVGIAPVAGIYLGTGTGGLTPGPPFAGSLHQVVVGYLDDDTNQDLVASVPPAGGLEIYLGNGDATFASAGIYLSGLQVNDLALGDFDGNDALDIVAYVDAGWLSNTRYLLFGDGNGAFTVSQQSEETDQFFTVGDFDADDRLDIASLYPFSKVTFHYGNGDGTFPDLIYDQAGETAFSENAGAPGGVKSLGSADFDGDGWLDFVWCSELVRIRLGNGDGSFAPAASCSGTCWLDGSVCMSDEDCPGLFNYCVGVPNPDCFEAGAGPIALATGDVDGDGHQDVVTANSGSNDVSVLTGNGDGRLAASVEYPAGNTPVDVSIGLFDSGSTPDLAVANVDSNDVSVLLGNGDGSFGTQTTFAAGTGPSSVAAGDLDRDGEVDLAVANQGSNNVSVLIGNGDGTFMDSVEYAVGPSPGDVAIGDLNRDGLPDLVVSSPQGWSLSLLLGVGGGLFADEVRIPVPRPLCVAIADVDFDGRQDLLLCGSSPGLTLMMGQGDDTFGAPHRFDEIGFTVADFDGNGRLDFSSGVTFLNTTNPATFSVEPDKQTLTWPKIDDATSYNMYRGNLGDLVDGDGDGLPDLGYGDCKNDLDPSLVDRVFIDDELPAAGASFFYLMSYLDVSAVELGLGTTSDGASRNVVSRCP